MKVSKRQLRKIIKEEKLKLYELGIDRMERAMAEDDPDDMGPSIEAARQVLNHLEQIKVVLSSPGAQHFGADTETSQKMEDLAEIRDHFEDFLYYLEND